ncbi:MAG TPA: glycine cleavage T C-terminal barrel domain-containing protein [Longimicrobiaceae bacterium]|nr:glycine cleavage T C-terminal barrel domain-containing protein [Longimicrobiaceae bacterium]
MDSTPAVDTRSGSPSLEPLHDAAGAVWAEVGGRRVVRHYGDSLAEYRAVRESAGVAERCDRARIRLWGKDPVRMVQGLITNDLAGAPAGQGVYAALLTPKGRTIADLRAFRRDLPTGVEVLLDLSRDALEGTREHLKKFVPPMFARWADASDELAALGVYGPRAAELVGQVLGADVGGMAEDANREALFDEVPVLVAATRYVGLEEGFDLFVPADAASALWKALVDAGARPVGQGALETLRIEAGRPRYGAELTEEVIPTEAFEETGLLGRAISFTKGCYTGQEVIIRIAHRGHVNRHLRGLLLGDAPAAAPGTPLFNPASGRESGRLTSVAWSPRLAQTVALGYVRREVEPGGTVRLGSAEGTEARVVRLPFDAA